MPNSSRTIGSAEILGRVCALSTSRDAPLLLASTVANGCHVFSLSDSIYSSPSLSSAHMSNEKVETFSSEVVGKIPFLSSCWNRDDETFVLGSSQGEVVVVSRKKRKRIGSCVLTEDIQAEKSFFSSSNGIRSLHSVQHHQSAVIACRDVGANVIDTSRMCSIASFTSIVPRAIGAQALDPNTVAVANYDGKVLLFDIRNSVHSLGVDSKPDCIISVPDQICSFSMCEESGSVCAGTVSGRVFVLRCTNNSSVRECAFAIGNQKRSPIRALVVEKNKVVAGDIAGRVALLDLGDRPDPTVYWTPEQLYTPHDGKASALCVSSSEKSFCSFHSTSSPHFLSQNWSNAEVTGVAICGKTVWAAFCVHGADHCCLATLAL